MNDFKWHRVQQSPHWSILPEAERVRVSKDPSVSMGDDAAVSVTTAGGTVAVLRSDVGKGAAPSADAAEESDDEEL